MSSKTSRNQLYLCRIEEHLKQLKIFFRSKRAVHGCSRTIPVLPEEAKYRR